MKQVRLIGSGSYLPARVLHNQDLESMVDTSDSWIFERTGIRERRIADAAQSVCDLAVPAAQSALEMSGRSAEQIDLVIVATSTPAMPFPSTACLLQQRLGIHGGAAFDVQAACTGFIYALSVAEKFLKLGAARTALVVGTETLSRIVDWTDRGTCILFGDGAGAVVLQADDTPGILATHVHADGAHADLLNVPSEQGKPIDGPQREGFYIRMAGSEVFKVAVQTLGTMVEDILVAEGLQHSDIDWLVPHQANQRIIQSVARRLNLPMSKVVMTMERHGNTSAASIPLALDEAIRDGRVQPGQLLLLEAFGGGFTWGSALVRF
jgi:3-oxoacyl-[acyl-carrier-protein] synthase III